MRDDNYYRYYEIIHSLRKEYIKNEILLNKLKSYIQVESDKPYSSNFEISLDDGPRDPLELILRIHKHQPKIIEKISDAIVYDPRYIDRSLAIMKVKEEESDLIITRGSSRTIEPKNYNPNIEIIDSIAFKEIYDELMHSKLSMLPRLLIYINEFQSLRVEGGGLSLWTKFEHIWHILCMDYISQTDNIYSDLGKLSSTDFAEQLLKTKIPKFEFPDEYKDIIENNLDIYDFIIEGRLKNNKNYLEIVDNEKKLIMRKK